MPAPVIVIVVASVVASAALVWLYFYSGPKKESPQRYQSESSRESPRRYHSRSDLYGNVPYSNPQNNHDHMKVGHATRQDAIRVVDQMKQRGVSGSELLNEYYNAERGLWYVGRSKWGC